MAANKPGPNDPILEDALDPPDPDPTTAEPEGVSTAPEGTEGLAPAPGPASESEPVDQEAPETEEDGEAGAGDEADEGNEAAEDKPSDNPVFVVVRNLLHRGKLHEPRAEVTFTEDEHRSGLVTEHLANGVIAPPDQAEQALRRADKARTDAASRA